MRRKKAAMHKITTILWDVDDTLLDFDYSQKCALAKCFRTLGREITESEIRLYAQINEGYWKRLELGEVTKAQLLRGRFVTLFRELGMKVDDLEGVLREYQETLGSVFCFRDDSLTILRNLQGRVKQYVVTNGVTRTQKNKLKLSGLAEVLDGIFISEEIGSPKPQKPFFDYCLEQIEEKDKSRILIVGDSLSSDIRGGLQAGIVTCWYHPASVGADGACFGDGQAGGGFYAESSFSGKTQNNGSGDLQVSAAVGEVNRLRELSGGVAGCAGTVAAEAAYALGKPDYVISDLHMIYDIVMA